LSRKREYLFSPEGGEYKILKGKGKSPSKGPEKKVEKNPPNAALKGIS